MVKVAKGRGRGTATRFSGRFLAIGFLVAVSATTTGARSGVPGTFAVQPAGPMDVAGVLGIPRPSAASLAVKTAPRPLLSSGLPNIMNPASALSAAVITNVNGQGVNLLGDWDGQEDLVADHAGRVADVLTPNVIVTRSAISEHTIANGFAEDVFYYGDSVGNLYVAASTTLNDPQPAPQLLTINLPTTVTAFGAIASDSQIVVTGIAVNPVADLTAFANASGAYGNLDGLVGEVVYVAFTDTSNGFHLAGNQLVRSGVLAFPVADVATPASPPPGVISIAGYPVTVDVPLAVAFSIFSNVAGVAVDDDGSVYFQQVDLIGFTGANIMKVASTGSNQTRTLATNGITTIGTLDSLNLTVGGPAGQTNTFTNYSGNSTLWGNVVALASGPGNVLYAAVARSFVAGDDAATQSTEGLFTNPTALGATPSMIVSLADCSGAFDGCLLALPVPNGVAEAAAPGLALTPGVTNFRVFAMGDGPDRRGAPGSASPVFGTTNDTLKVSFQVDYSIYAGLTVDEEGSVYVVSGGTPAGAGRNPSPTLGEILIFPDADPADRRADFVDLRGDSVPSPPLPANVGDFDSDRFDHIFWQAPMDIASFTPMGVSGLARGFLLYLNRLRTNDLTPGLTNGRPQGDDDRSTTAVLFGQLDPGHQVGGGDDQVFPFRGDDSDGGGLPAVPGPLEGGFEFAFSNGGAVTSYNGFFLNSNGNITFGAGDTTFTPTADRLVNGLPRIAPAWTDLDPSGRLVNPISFPVQAVGFAAVNHFKIRWINVPSFASESCNCRNTFSISLFDDGTGLDENASQPLNQANPIGNNAVPFDRQEGPTALRWTVNAAGQIVGRRVRPAGSGYFTFAYGRMDLLGSSAIPVVVGFSAGSLPSGGPNQQTVNFSTQPSRIGDGSQLALYEIFNSGLGLSPAFDLRFEGNSPLLCTPSGQPDPNRGILRFTGFVFPGHLPFSNEPAVANVTPIRAGDIGELRLRINSLRSRVPALGSFVYTDVNVNGGSPILAREINELRQALTDVYVAMGLAAPAFTDGPLVPGVSAIKAIHIQELRDLVGALE